MIRVLRASVLGVWGFWVSGLGLVGFRAYVLGF